MSVPSWRRGLVHQVQGYRVRVKFPDLDGLITDWLPVAQLVTLGARSFLMPRQGAQVVVLLDEHGEDGVVLPGIYSQADPPPGCDAAAFYLEQEDGTKLILEAGKITLDTPGDLVAKAGGQATVEAPQITLKGSVKIEGSLEVSDAVDLKSGLKVANDATISGKSFLTHTHTSSSPGSPTTPPN